MFRKGFVTLAFASWLGITQAAAEWDAIKNFIHAAYFSDSCRQQAESFGITGTSSASTLFAEFSALAQRVNAGGDKLNLQRDGCVNPAILLINVLRANGIDAELVFASRSARSAANDASKKIDRVLVFVPELDLYLDPAASPGKQAVLDQITRETMRRVHIAGPSVSGRDGACRDTCMRDYSPLSHIGPRIKTEVIRNR